MEIILIKDVENLGYANDIVTVRPGYANNYLIPQGFAKAATASAKKILADAQALAATLENLNLTFTVKAEEGRIFGSITSADVAEALAAKGVEVDKKNITVEGIKTVGEYKVAVKLHREVKAEVAITVVAEE